MPWILGGDFNEILDSTEKMGGLDRMESDMREIREAIDVCEVFDPGVTGPKYTWCNNHVNHGVIWEKLDRFLINPNMKSRCSVFRVHHLARVASDHRLLLVEWKEEPLDPRKETLRRPKRFEESWTKYDVCREIVEQVWQGNNTRTFIEKLKDCLIKLGRWSRTHYDGSIRGAILRKEKENEALLSQGEE